METLLSFVTLSLLLVFGSPVDTREESSSDIDLISLVRNSRRSLDRKALLQAASPAVSSTTPTVTSLAREDAGKEAASDGSLRTVPTPEDDIEQMLKPAVDWFVRKVTSMMMEGGGPSVSHPCLSSLLKLLRDLRRLKKWAFEMVDATGKLPAGIMEGTVVDLGAFDQCLAVEAPTKTGDLDFRGQYCMVTVVPPQPPLPKNASVGRLYPEYRNDTVLVIKKRFQYAFHYMKGHLGVCVPSTCTREDTKEIMDAVAKSVFPKFPVDVEVPHCQVKEGIKVETVHIVMICVVALQVLLVAAGTTLDVLRTRSISFMEKKSQWPNLLSSLLIQYSVPKNVKKLMSRKTSVEDLGVLHGLRIFSLIYVLLIHTHLWIKIASLRRSLTVKHWYNDVKFEVILNGWVSVDSFFVISGVLTTYYMLPALEKKKGRVNVPLLVILRYLRLTPMFAFTVGLLFFLPWVSSGPFWYQVVEPELNNCNRSWWINILYFNNFLPVRKICIHYSWYVQCDLQLYVLAIFLVILLHRKPVVGILGTTGAVVASIVTLGVLTYVYELTPMPLMSIPDEDFGFKVSSLIHVRPYTHLAPYCVGMFVGYFLVRHRRVTLSPAVQVVAWCLAISISISCLLGTHEWNKGNFPPLLVTAVYASLYRTGWSLGVGWIVYASATGHGGPINAILSYKGLLPFSRLTYCAYLVQGLIIWVRAGSGRERHFVSHYNAIYELGTHMVLIMILAFICHLLVEAPSANLVRLMFFGGKKKEEGDQDSNQKEESPTTAQISRVGPYSNHAENGKDIVNNSRL